MTAETTRAALLGCDEPEFEPVVWRCSHCDGYVGVATDDDHWCLERGRWHQDRLQRLEAALVEASEAKGLWFQTGASEANPSDDSYRSGPAVSEADLTRLADRRYAKAEDEPGTDGWDQAIGALLGPAATYDQVHDWVETHRTKDGGR